MKKSRKDLFRKAVADNLNEKGQENADLGDFVSDMKRSRSDAQQEKPDVEEGAGSEKTEKPAGKNGLPEQKKKKKLAQLWKAVSKD